MSRAVDVVAPPRLGPGFRWLLGSTWTSNLGDGLALAAGPLLVASQTKSAFLIALGATVQWLPPLLFGLVAGVLIDRLDRRAIVIVVDLVRAVVLGVLAATIVTGTVSVAVALAALFALGTAEVFADNASQTLLPMLVGRDDLAVGNARLQTGFVTLNQLAGPPVGAAFFAAGMAWPFVAEAVLVLAAVGLITRITLPPRAREPISASMRKDVAEGVRFVRRHAAVRTLVLTIFIFNVTFGAAWSVLVLYATQRLHLGAVGYGLITTVPAAGGLLATLGYGMITRHVSLLIIFFVFGAHAFVWGTTSITIRQRAVPTELQGRVNSVNVVGVFGGLVIGSAAGGLLAQHYGVTAPFWFAFAGSAVFVVLIWRQLAHIAHADTQPVAAQ